MQKLISAAILYAVLWGINIAWGNVITIFLQSLLSTGLFVVIALYVNALDEEAKEERERMQKEIDELRKAVDKI